MPAKRSAASAPSRAKKSRPSTDANDGPDTGDSAVTNAAHPPIPRSKRWAPVSGSANADMGHKMASQNPVTAYAFVCLCQPPFRTSDDDDDDDDEWEDAEDGDGDEGGDENEENKDPENSGKQKRGKCDGGKTCICDKPASEHPDHIWKLSAAGKDKFFTQRIHVELRSPDNFGMYTFNDHEGYGVLEVLQNLVLDFEEAAGNYKEQWAVCEALAFFLSHDSSGVVTQIDDGDAVGATYELIGRLFMSMLAQLEREKLLAKDSEIKSLGLIMALFMDFANDSRANGLLEDSKTESLGPAKDKKKWAPQAFDNQILAYSRKYDIELVGPSSVEKSISDADADVDLPVPESNTGKADPFGFAKYLKKYTKDYGGVTAFMAQNKTPLTPIGGDSLDITTWTSAKRKSKAFDKKDPLGKAELKALKEGMVMQLG